MFSKRHFLRKKQPDKTISKARLNKNNSLEEYKPVIIIVAVTVVLALVAMYLYLRP